MRRQVSQWMRRPLVAWALGWMLLFGAHAWLVHPLLQNGDAAVYNDQIDRHAISIRTTHVGYMLLGIALRAVSPLGLDLTMNVASLAFGAAGAVALVAIARRYGASRPASLFAALLAFGIHPYLRGSVLSEVDVVACALVVLALAAWVYGRRVLAGAAFGWAMLVTPVTAPTLPIFLLTKAGARKGLRPCLRDLRDVLVFGAASLALYAPFVLLFWHDYWVGGRGILRAPHNPWNVGAQVSRSVHFLIENASPWLALGVGGALAFAIAGESLGLGVLAAVVVTAIVSERFWDVPVQLPNMCVLVVFVVLALSRLPRRTLAASVLLAVYVITAWPTYGSVIHEVATKREQRATFLAMATQTPKFFVVGLEDSWNEGLPFERMVYGRSGLGLGVPLKSFSRSPATFVATRKEYAIWVLQSLPPETTAFLERGWHRETRSVRDHSYEVWIPAAAL
jgi:hypothetical protein